MTEQEIMQEIEKADQRIEEAEQRHDWYAKTKAINDRMDWGAKLRELHDKEIAQMERDLIERCEREIQKHS